MTPAPSRLAATLAAACEQWSSRPAITSPDGTLTYAELGDGVRALAAAYWRAGIGPGDRVVCQFPNCAEHVMAMAAAWAVGALHVGTDHDLTGPELAWLVRHLGAAALLFQPHALATEPTAALDEVRAMSPGTHVFVRGAAPDADVTPLDTVLADHGGSAPTVAARSSFDPAIVHLTSGTTGRPKGVLETLPGCWGKMQFFADAFGPGPDDALLLFLPMAHVFGLRLALIPLLSGGRLVLMDRFSPGGALDVIATEGVTVLPGMPAHFRLLLDRLDTLDALDDRRPDTSSLRWAISAAATLPAPLAQAVYDRLRVELLFVYGCSENFTTLTTDRHEILRGSVGKTVYRGPEGTAPDGRIRIVDPATRARLPDGDVGEIAFGASRPVQYWADPDAATDGWYYTGDLGRIDEQGCVHVVGRLKELVNRGGLKVAPTEIESNLARHPQVSDAAVVGTPDPVLGEAICACVVASEDAAPALADLRAFLGATLARHKLPDELCLVERIPRTKIGKVDRPALLQEVMRDGRARERLRPR